MKERESSPNNTFGGEASHWQAGYKPELAQRIEQALQSIGNKSPADIMADYYQDKSDNHGTAYVEAFALLPDENPSLAYAIFREFAESSDPDDRDEIVMYVPNLCRVNHDAGIELWDHLVRDPHPGVRRTAYDELSERLDQPSLDPVHQATNDEQLAELGLTWRDVAYLSRAYIEAERHPNQRYQPGTRPSQDGDHASH